MGQYHGIYNIDKKEYFSFGGATLWEKAYEPLCSMGLNVLLCNSNGRGGGDLCNPIHKDFDKNTYSRWSNTLQKKVKETKLAYQAIESSLALIAGRWSGCRIVIQGDYAERKDPAYLSKNRLADFKDITPLVIDAFERILIVDSQDDDDSKKMLGTIKFERELRKGRI
jgi:hypothetical protein